MARYRIGNDMTIIWSVTNKDGSSFPLAGKEVHLYYTCERGRFEADIQIQDNVVAWDFLGSIQRVLGDYTLTLEVLQSNGKRVIKRDICNAFTLVGKGCEGRHGKEDGEINDGGVIELVSELEIFRISPVVPVIEKANDGIEYWFVDGVNTGKPSTGKSAYEYAKEKGYEGTESEYAESLKLAPENAEKLTELSEEFNGKRENFDIKVNSFTYVILSDYDVQDSAELSIVNTLAKNLRVDTQDSQENIVNTYIIPSESTSNIKISEGEVRLRLNSADTGSVEILFSKGIKASFVELEIRTDNKIAELVQSNNATITELVKNTNEIAENLIAETDAKLDQIESQTYNKVEDYEIKNDAKLAELSDTTNASIAALENQTNRELSTTNQQILQINKEFNDIVFEYEVKPSSFTYVVLSDYGLSQDESLYIKNNGSKNLRVDALDASNETLQYIIIASETEQKFLIPSGTIRLRLNSAESANVSVVVKGINSSLAELEEAVNTLNEGGLVLNESKIKEQVNSWLNSHPEATTTIQDASVTDSKIAASLKELTYNNYVTPQMFGAKGDGKTDDTNAFILAQESGKNIYVPIGQYVVNNFTFSASVEWYFQPSMGSPWFAEGCAEIHTSTGLTISNSPKIHNLVVKYNGQENDASKRPIGLKMLTHWAELHRLHISHFYIGMAFGKDAGGHSDYTRVYNANIWYCYKCGVSLDAVGESQVNFISFYDCNVGSNGVDVHNTEKEPNVERGYGFYIATCNGVAINNSDVSSNETCGFYIDASSSDKRARGLIVPTFYAEHNKYCDIYYKNGVNSSATRTGDVEFSVGYIFHNSQDIYYQANVYCENLYLPPCVKLLGVKGTEYKAEKSALLECIDMLYSVKFASDATIDKFTFFGKPRKTYKIKLLLKGISTGTITFQNIIYGAAFLDDYYSVDNRVEVQKSHSVSVVEGEQKEVEFVVSMPSTEYKLCLYNALPYGASAEVIDGSVELVE